MCSYGHIGRRRMSRDLCLGSWDPMFSHTGSANQSQLFEFITEWGIGIQAISGIRKQRHRWKWRIMNQERSGRWPPKNAITVPFGSLHSAFGSKGSASFISRSLRKDWPRQRGCSADVPDYLRNQRRIWTKGKSWLLSHLAAQTHPMNVRADWDQIGSLTIAQ